MDVCDFSKRSGPGRGFKSWSDALWLRVLPGGEGCLIYAGDSHGNGGGYGRVCFGGKRKLAHHVAWYLHSGEWPEGKELDHLPSCDKRCVNVKHLTLLTRSEHQKLTMRRQEERPRYMYPYQDACSVENCARKPYGNGLCSMHYQRKQNGVAMDTPPMSRSQSGTRGALSRWNKEKV